MHDANYYRNEARRLYQKRRGICYDQPALEVADAAEISKGIELPGAWVQAWIWIPDTPAAPAPEATDAVRPT